MPITDWAVWPIFIAQMIALILLFIPQKTRKRDLHLKTVAMWILFLVAIAIMVSLYHDSTEVLNLHF